MKIALAQIESEIGNIAANIEHHVQVIDRASKLGAQLVIFPELSLTGYAPELAGELAMEREDSRLSIFKKLSEERNISIGIGLPIRTAGKPQIGLLLFEPGQEPILSGKQYLHEDELADFSPGTNYCGPVAGHESITLAICYELSVEAHAKDAHERKAGIYLASAAKTPSGVVNASARLSNVSRQYQMISLLCNCVGICEGQTAGGGSGVWDTNGQRVAQLNDRDEAILMVDTEKMNSERYLL